jgi:Ca-activated chloride channel homolog
MRPASSSRSPLLLALVLAAGCASGGDPNSAPAPGSGKANYGEERIGYKFAADARAAEGASPPLGSSSTGGTASYGPSGGLYAGDPWVSGGGSGGASFAPTFPENAAADAGGALIETPEDAGAVSADNDGGAVTPLGTSQLLASPPGTPLQPENPFRVAADMPASTFSIDVDTGSYTLARASLNAGFLPDPASVRIEEFLNYFHFHYAQPAAPEPFSVYTELSACPWDPERELLLLGIQGQEVPLVDQPPANLVYLIDVSGSMFPQNRLPLLKSGFRMLTRQLRPQDRVSIVTYAGHESVLLQGVSGADKATILSALDGLEAGGSTNGAGGIQRAYELAEEHFISGGNNRVLLATDGDFNVGLSGAEALSAFIATKRETGVFLSVYGVGEAWGGGNYQDGVAEQLADNGNGVYFYIDGPEEARRAFIHTVTGSLLTLAKDVKVQVQFNTDAVRAYRLIGYENRVLSNAAFDNDAVDAGELGAGLSVTALFELIPAGSSAPVPEPLPGTDPLEALVGATPDGADDPELAPVTGDALVEVRVRYKDRDGDDSKRIATRYARGHIATERPSMKFLFASAVSELAMQLRGSQYLPAHRTRALQDQIRRALPADAEGAVTELHGVATTGHGLMAGMD